MLASTYVYTSFVLCLSVCALLSKFLIFNRFLVFIHFTHIHTYRNRNLFNFIMTFHLRICKIFLENVAWSVYLLCELRWCYMVMVMVMEILTWIWIWYLSLNIKNQLYRFVVNWFVFCVFFSLSLFHFYSRMKCSKYWWLVENRQSTAKDLKN